MKLINEQQVFETWAPMLQEKTGIENREKLSWMARYCHFHSLNESFTYPAAGGLNIPGMGNVTPAGDAAGGANLFYSDATTGSGDKFPSLLPIAIQVAGRTVGFDIVSVIPMNGPSGVLTYLDYVYGGGKQPNDVSTAGSPDKYNEKPLVFTVRLKKDAAASPAADDLVVGETYFFVRGNNALKVAYTGKSLIEGLPTFRILGEMQNDGGWTTVATHTLTFSDVFDYDADNDGLELQALLGTAPSGTALGWEIPGYPTLVAAAENHIQGFHGAGPNDDQAWVSNNTSGKVPFEPMRRGVGEEMNARTMNLRPFTKFVEAGTFEVNGTTSIEQIQDLSRQFGIDVVSMLENALIQDISQAINKHILSRAFSLGWQNHHDFNQIEGISMNLNLSSSTPGTDVEFLGKDNDADNLLAIPVPGFADFNPSGSSYENLGTIQRRIFSKTLAAGNIVAQRGRRGPANFVVTNLQLATALQDNAQFTPYAMTNTINQNNGVYPIGTIAGMTVYVDPNMAYNDTRILVGRKGADEEPGLKYMPYLIAESFSTVAEGSMSPKVLVKSRYSLTEAGHHPQTMYFAFFVQVPEGGVV